MKVQAEVSLYPLRTPELNEAIGRFLSELEEGGLEVCPGNMSTTVSGDAEKLFAAMGKAFESVAHKDAVVLVLKVSNACPV